MLPKKINSFLWHSEKDQLLPLALLELHDAERHSRHVRYAGGQ